MRDYTLSKNNSNYINKTINLEEKLISKQI